MKLIKARYPHATEIKTRASGIFGIIYGSYHSSLQQNSIALDENWILVGKIRKITKEYVEIITLNHPGLQFNVANLSEELIGLAKTTGLGYIEVDFVDPKKDIKIGDLILTGGNDEIFPKGFLIGEVVKIETKGYFQKITILPLANFESEKLIILQ